MSGLAFRSFPTRFALAAALVACLLMIVSCETTSDRPPPSDVGGRDHADLRDLMVKLQIQERGVSDARVLSAMRTIPRHLFVPEDMRPLAYTDGPLPIGHDQTISQPYIVAIMTELMELEGDETVLEIGTGSGYQAAVLATIAREVYTIEIVEPLARTAQERLSRMGHSNVVVRHGDGYRGWPEHAPFDAIIVTAAPDHVPQPLIDQLAPGGRLVIPVGSYYQELLQLRKTEGGIIERRVIPVRFVPMTGEAERGGE